jgi:hypothetical protein
VTWPRSLSRAERLFKILSARCRACKSRTAGPPASRHRPAAGRLAEALMEAQRGAPRSYRRSGKWSRPRPHTPGTAGKRSPALHAEPHARRVLELAAPASHRHLLPAVSDVAASCRAPKQRAATQCPDEYHLASLRVGDMTISRVRSLDPTARRCRVGMSQSRPWQWADSAGTRPPGTGGEHKGCSSRPGSLSVDGCGLL